MNSFSKMDVAIELLAEEISTASIRYNKTNNTIYKEQLNELINQREKLYNCDVNIINSIIENYGSNNKNEVIDTWKD